MILPGPLTTDIEMTAGLSGLVAKEGKPGQCPPNGTSTRLTLTGTIGRRSATMGKIRGRKMQLGRVEQDYNHLKETKMSSV